MVVDGESGVRWVRGSRWPAGIEDGAQRALRLLVFITDMNAKNCDIFNFRIFLDFCLVLNF